MEHQNHNNLTQYITSQPLQKVITKILLSVSVFSFIISYSSWCSFFLHYIKFYLIAFPWQLVSHALDKSYIFLICNGILVFIAKTSSLVRPPSGRDLNDLLERKFDDDLQTSSEIEDSLLEKGDLLESAKPQEDAAGHGGRYENETQEAENHEKGRVDEDLKEEQTETESLIVKDKFFNVKGECDEGKEEEIVTYIAGDDQDEKDFDKGLCMREDEETEKDYEDKFIFEEGKGDERIELLSTEELNKKFEDFIRRMKEDLRIEAQQQLVMVK